MEKTKRLTPIKIEKSLKTPKLPSKVVSFWRAKRARKFGNLFLITGKSKRKTLQQGSRDLRSDHSRPLIGVERANEC